MRKNFYILGLFGLIISQDSITWINPNSIQLPRGLTPSTMRIQGLYPSVVGLNYTIQPHLQKFTENWIKTYQPDFSGVVLLDAETGNILVNTSRSIEEDFEEFNYLARFTSASVFKVITAAAAINEKLLRPQSQLQQVGRTTSLNAWQLKEQKKSPRWMRKYTLEDSLALSINAVFGKIGMNLLGEEILTKYGEKAGFNREIPFQQEIEMSTIRFPSSSIETAQLASGYGQLAKLSPLHGALLAASFINGGYIPRPNMIKSVQWDGDLYFPTPKHFSKFISSQSSKIMASMMKKTLSMGTAKKHFRKFPWHEVNHMGGKTGHLFGFEPKGYHDWFIGFMEVKQEESIHPRKLAIAILNVSKKNWKFKSGKLASEIFTEYLKNSDRNLALNLTRPKISRRPGSSLYVGK